jgi:hypothetical protein
MMIIRRRSTSPTTLQRDYPGASVIDMTSRGEQPWVRFSPFYPHGGIPVPFSEGWSSASVEGIWQGLKVFERADIDTSKFRVTSMKNLKRSARVYGGVRGHRKGVEGDELLAYVQARRMLYLPSYRWMLEHCVQKLLAELSQLAQEQTVVLLDYETNEDIEAVNQPLSHAGLVKRYMEGRWPDER